MLQQTTFTIKMTQNELEQLKQTKELFEILYNKVKLLDSYEIFNVESGKMENRIRLVIKGSQDDYEKLKMILTK